MKDKRVIVFRTALEEVIESLDATLRVMRWDSGESVPEPLQESASRLVARLGAADRLASGVFKGTAADVQRVTAITESMKKLDAAYLAYRKKLGAGASEREKAAKALDALLDEIRSEGQSS
jgi:hypothetical protein